MTDDGWRNARFLLVVTVLVWSILLGAAVGYLIFLEPVKQVRE